MNVCMVAYTFYDSDNRVRRYAETLAKRGNLVDFIALRHVGQPKVETINGVTIHRIQMRALNEKTKWSYLIRLSVFLVRSFLFITFNHLKKKYRLIHVHSVPDFEVFSAIVPKLTGAKVILDIHDIVPEFYISKFGTSRNGTLFKILIFIEKLSCAFADHVIIANHIWEEVLTSRSVPYSKCTTIINYPDTDLFQPGNWELNHKELVLMYPGTLNWHQGVDLVIKAFPKILDKYSDARFMIFGDGPERSNLEQLVAEKGLEENIHFMGLVNIEKIAEEMCLVDIGIVPKRADGFGDEAFSTKTMEFMALGVPVIISDARIDLYYFNNEIATFFKAGDSDDLARTIIEFISDPSRRKHQAERASRFLQENSWSVKQDLYLKIVDQLVGTSYVQ